MGAHKVFDIRYQKSKIVITDGLGNPSVVGDNERIPTEVGFVKARDQVITHPSMWQPSLKPVSVGFFYGCYKPVIHDDFRDNRIGPCRRKWGTKRKPQPWELRAVTGSAMQ